MQAPNIRNNTIAKKGWSKAIILVIAWMLIFSLAKDFWQVRKGFSRIEEAKTRLVEEEARNQMLKDKLAAVVTEEYKERIIREQLNMQKVGEVVAVLPTTKPPVGDEVEPEEQTEENWQKWWALLR